MDLTRSSGILLHPTSFPGPHGIGDLGQAAYDFIDFLVRAGQTLWQVLPIGPTGYGDSPYASFSSLAGNPLLINLKTLLEMGDLDELDLAHVPDFPVDTIDYGRVINWKRPLLEKAALNFLEFGHPERKATYDAFCFKQASWLDDFATFMAVKRHFDRKAQQEKFPGAMWSNYWDKAIARHEPEAVAHWQAALPQEIAVEKVLQYYFYRQWGALRHYANSQGVRIIGDVPIFVAPDSVEAWATPEIFFFDDNRRMTVVSGVPPDYFSATGQLWGNPLYNWDALAEHKYDWWIKRIQGVLNHVDIIRIDHFRGFEAYWEIPAGEKTAINGAWVKAPGMEFFETVKNALGDAPIIAEDLGIITPEVEELRDHFNFPGMKILQFAFDASEAGAMGATNAYLPHNYAPNCVVYTGTHDNDTTLGWYQTRTQAEKDLIRRYLARDDKDVVWNMIRLALSSSAALAIIPLQDALSLGSAARMNTPSTSQGNWAWRYRPEQLSEWVSVRLKEMVELYGRNPKVWAERARRDAAQSMSTKK
jgi:4-alpha-glucanotransferase